MRIYAALLLPFVSAAFGAGQTFLQAESYDSGLFTPYENLHALSAHEYTTLHHPYFPAHSVRVKESRVCDGEVRAYTGYIDVEARHHFFYFFESRNDPDSDDVLFWTNGGPGGSSALGLFSELGPCRITSPNTTERFEHSWNQRANVFFIDQPVGVGFSYAEYGEQVSSTAEAAKDISAFVAIFFEHFTKFKGRPFHMAGESYGGRYVPMYAAAVFDRNAELVEAGIAPINLTSIMLGNGGTDWIGTLLSLYDLQCGDYGFPTVTSISECVRMKQLVARCKKRYQASCVDVLDNIDCASAVSFCWDATAGFLNEINAYDSRKPCRGNKDINSCYPETGWLNEYLNIPSVQALLGVDPAHSNYTAINMELNARFEAAGDFYSFRAEDYVAALLERGVDALIYAGATDWICNWVGNERMTLELEWSGQDAYRGAELREWTVEGKPAGKTRSGGGLTFATIYDAGHMAPFDQPVRSLELANRWFARQPL